MLKMLKSAVDAANDDPLQLASANAELVLWQAEVEAHRRAEEQQDIDRCIGKVVGVSRWWLAQRCPAWSGTKFQVVRE